MNGIDRPPLLPSHVSLNMSNSIDYAATSNGSNPPSPSPPSGTNYIPNQPFTPSEPSTDEPNPLLSYPSSPAYPAVTEVPIQESIRNFNYPSSPLYNNSISLSIPRSDSLLDHSPSHLAPQLHHPNQTWSPHHGSLPTNLHYHQPHSSLTTSPSFFSNTTLTPPSPFGYPSQDFLWQSTDIDNYNSTFYNNNNNNIRTTIQQPSPNLAPMINPTTPIWPKTKHSKNPTKSINSTTILNNKLLSKNHHIKTKNKIPHHKFPIRICADCKTTNTPEWRSGPSGERNFCNACGLRWKKQLKIEKSKKSQSLIKLNSF
ncbi:hypothetical protein CROQUDRAFT_655693 [Cronartium quercuum f. sp. fusiforme G11]|uniref:GATA-type domain-containing protein n=1 Tax=Cronartium quercuum f. sp. fusiforme G11 TaxID=708437 RepID=A0A9P6NP58_9BASI|nr:hypothetical protein CROQUDRAFT_655693 [Cronartium quercuum f. sp. fusiforme G11]